MKPPSSAGAPTSRRPRAVRSPQTQIRNARRRAAERLGSICARLADNGAFPLDRWVLPEQERTPMFLAVLGDVYGSDSERDRQPGRYRTRFDCYRDDYNSVMPIVRRAALDWAVKTLNAEEAALRKFLLQLVSERGLGDHLHDAAARAERSAAGFGTTSRDEAREDWGDAHPRSAPPRQSGATPSVSEVQELRQAEERATQRRRARIAWAVKQQRVDELSILFQHPQGLAIVGAYSESAAAGSQRARGVLDDAILAIGAFRDALTKPDQVDHVWRYPVLVSGGVAELGLRDVPGFPNYAVAIGQVLGRNRTEAILGALGVALLCVGLVFTGPVGIAVIAMGELALGGAAAGLAYVREHEQRLAAGASSFRGETRQFAESSGYADTLLNGAAALLSAMALVRAFKDTRKLLHLKPRAAADVVAPARGAATGTAARSESRAAAAATERSVPGRIDRPPSGVATLDRGAASKGGIAADTAPKKDWQDFLPDAKRRVGAVKHGYHGVDLQANANRSRGTARPERPVQKRLPDDTADARSVPARAQASASSATTVARAPRNLNTVPEFPITPMAPDRYIPDRLLGFFRENRSAYPKEIRRLIDAVPLKNPPRVQLQAIDKALRDLHTAEANRMAGFANAPEKPFINSVRGASNEGGKAASLVTDQKVLTLKGQIRGGGTVEFDSVEFTGSRIIEKKLSLQWTTRGGKVMSKPPDEILQQMKSQAQFVDDWKKWSQVEWHVHDLESARLANGVHGQLEALHPDLASRIVIRADFAP